MADDQFATVSPTITGAALGAFAVTPDDGADLAASIRQVTLGTGGTLSYVSSRNGVTYTTATLPAGSYALFASRILATGTTASDITGWI